MDDHQTTKAATAPAVEQQFLPGSMKVPIPIVKGPTAEDLRLKGERDRAEALAGQICATAAVTAQTSCHLLELIGTFDANNDVRYWTDIKSLAHWLAWTCSMTPGVAREHVRIARALQKMPTATAAFRQGRLSYSKVREVTRVVDQEIDEAKLCEMALTATASQLARMISGFRTSNGSRLPQQAKRVLSWHGRDDGMTHLTARLPTEEAALVIAALNAARDQFAPPPPNRTKQQNQQAEEQQRITDQRLFGTYPAGGHPTTSDNATTCQDPPPAQDATDQRANNQAVTGEQATDPKATGGGANDPKATDEEASDVETAAEGVGEYSNADAFLDICRVFLDTAPEDRSGEDRTTVMVHVNAHALGQDAQDQKDRHDQAQRLADTEHHTSADADHDQPHQANEGDDEATLARPKSVPAGTSSEPASTEEQDESVPAGMPTASPASTETSVKNVPAGTPPTSPANTDTPVKNVPAGTSADPINQICHIEGIGGIEPATAAKLTCDNRLIGAIIDKYGNVLAMGRTQRLVTPKQRRALMIRDRICQYPGCPQNRHLKAHHIISWLYDGLTDLDNLILLCQWHHTTVHEGHLTITNNPHGNHTGTGRAPNRWTFRLPNGEPIEQPTPNGHPPYRDTRLAFLLTEQTKINNINSYDHPAAQTIRPGWAGETFNLHECVQALFNMRMPPKQEPDQDHHTDQVQHSIAV